MVSYKAKKKKEIVITFRKKINQMHFISTAILQFENRRTNNSSNGIFPLQTIALITIRKA